ncbi:hypothetical protein EW145_g3520 [Phellinidium pouzarii]|uniref:Fungal-type protein kinase domain-containing protein n=1 Tax=Phellinidium pouzarii TaxID=167371 RepID=A0A4S4L772_9AGAM|nr:hypothetical protein EW145_g3520 [Phellinidium pouzarii]
MGDQLQQEDIQRFIFIWGSVTLSADLCVFWDDVKKRVIKDHWRDEDRRYNESVILEKIKGIPGTGQVDFSEVVKGPGHSGDLFTGTSKLRSRGKWSVLKSKGDPLSKRKSVLQVLKTVYDGIEAHQACLKYKRVLHRDVSRYNLLINPVHYDTEFDDEQAPVFGFLSAIVRMLCRKRVKEEVILIDWDNAADLEEGNVLSALTGRTGMPMFVSIGVAMGNIRRTGITREDFPVLTGEAKRLYVQAYSQEIYDNTDTDLIMTLNHLLIHYFENHNFAKDGSDFRESILVKDAAFWKAILHLELACLVERLEEMCLYLSAEWAYWPEPPEDHAHEAFKRLLLKAIL